MAVSKVRRTQEHKLHKLQESISGTFVPADEFRRLLVSSRKLVRSDQPGGDVRGLLDVHTGKLFLIERDKLLQKQPLVGDGQGSAPGT